MATSHGKYPWQNLHKESFPENIPQSLKHILEYRAAAHTEMQYSLAMLCCRVFHNYETVVVVRLTFEGCVFKEIFQNEGTSSDSNENASFKHVPCTVLDL